MAEFYPFNEAGCEILYENPHFSVAFGWDKQKMNTTLWVCAGVA